MLGHPIMMKKTGCYITVIKKQITEIKNLGF